MSVSIVSPDWLIEIDQGVGADHGVAVAELVRELDVDRNPRPLLDRVLADQARVGGRAARDDDDALDAGEAARRDRRARG